MLYGENVKILHKCENHAIYQLGDSDGEVMMTVYQVFPGIEIIYNDVHASMFAMQRSQNADVMEINHCREGRIEYKYGDNYYFLAPGDMAVSKSSESGKEASFPTGHYHGITVTIDPKTAPKSLSEYLPDVDVCPGTLVDKFCPDASYFSARSSASVEHIFSELYDVPEKIRKGYFKVKILELLLFLSALPIEQEQHSYTKSQVKLARIVGHYLMENTEKKLTVSDLSAQFGASVSLINSSFKGVYGMSPAAFLRAQKMHNAARMLRDTDRTVLDIAGQFGYDNGSKFAKAFKDIIGVSPNAYRNGIDRDSCAPEELE